MESTSAGKPRRSVILKFCPHTNDLLYPKEIPEEKKLIYKCKNCGYHAEIPEESYCVYVNEVRHSAKERTTILRDVRSDPTLPRTRDVRCPACEHAEAVYFSTTTPDGMTLFFNCTSCGHKWQESV